MWDVAGPDPEVLTKHTLPAAVAALEWHPTANELAATLLNNNLLAWQGVVPGHLIEPHVSVPDTFSLPGVPCHCPPCPTATNMHAQQVSTHATCHTAVPSGSSGGRL